MRTFFKKILPCFFVFAVLLAMCAFAVIKNELKEETINQTVAVSSDFENAEYDNLAYKVTFDCDEHASIVVYYTKEIIDGEETAVAYSRNSDTGELDKSGDGQVNFEVVLDEGYKVDTIDVTEGYKNLKVPSETGIENVYRITKITADLKVSITTTNSIPINDFATYTDESGYVQFSWESRAYAEYVGVTISYNDVVLEEKIDNIVVGTKVLWTFSGLEEDVRYDFTFQPYSSDDEPLQTAIFYSCYINPSIRDIEFNRVEITTKDYILPTCDYVSAPDGSFGAGITNNKYVYCTVGVFDSLGELVYSTGEEDFSDRIKIRGNTSAYLEKKPYKIKLSSKVDLLASLIAGRDDGVNYAHKEWILLAGGDSLNQVIGSSVSDAVGMHYTPAYSYVALYLNGNYMGLYILCESVSQGNGSGDTQGRLDVADDGFIVEYDAYWWNEDLYFTTPLSSVFNGAMYYTFKYPDSDDITADSPEYKYIQEYISKFENALMVSDPSFYDYIDIESFAKWLLAHDFLATYDPAGSNIYFIKKDSTEDSKLIMALLWDFDSICVYQNSLSLIRIQGWSHFSSLIHYGVFNELYMNLYNEVKNNIVSTIEDNIKLFNSEEYNKLLSIEATRSKKQITTLEEQSEIYLKWFEDHLEFMENAFNQQNSSNDNLDNGAPVSNTNENSSLDTDDIVAIVSVVGFFLVSGVVTSVVLFKRKRNLRIGK